MKPTPYEAINKLFNKLKNNIQNILGERLVGFYLYGSLAWDEFEMVYVINSR